jgi:hypothetical protein
MCDYSLHAIDSRPARLGDKLRTTSFTNCFTRGFCADEQPNVAVCLRPGTELAFDRDVEIDYGFGRLLPRFGFGRTGHRVARFRQINTGRLDTHHDALEFPNGRVVLVTRLCENQSATVLQLPHDEQTQSKTIEAHAEPSDAKQSPLTA